MTERADGPAALVVQVAAWGVLVLACACGRHDRAGTPPRVLVERRPASWFEHVTDTARVSADGRWALYGTAGRLELIDLESGAADDDRLRGGIAGLEGATFAPGGRLVRRAMIEGESRWLLDGGPTPLSLEGRRWPVWSPDGRRVASFDTQARTAGVRVDDRAYPLGVHLLGMAWTPTADAIVTLARGDDYTVALGRLDIVTGRHVTIRDGFDADVFPAHFSVATVDGRVRAFMSMVAPTRPDRATRHDPRARRDLDLWSVDLASGDATRVVHSNGDDIAPTVVGGRILWTQACIAPTVTLVSRVDGVSRTLVHGGELPYWSHDGSKVGFTVGGWRLRDVALPLDVDVLDVDADANATAAPRSLIRGFHEDFTPAWSPDGRWLAFHSHRSQEPVVSYAAPGSTDDMWIARSDDPAGTERRLTDFGHEAGTLDWAPDGRRLAFVSQSSARPGVLGAWILTIDPQTGALEASRPLPLPTGIRSAETLAWSPDGRWLAVESRTDQPGLHALWVVPVGGGPGRWLLDYESATFGGVDWVPDGSALVFGALAGQRMQLFEIAPVGGAPRQLTRDAVASVFLPQVSPDGRWVAATAMRHVRRIVSASLVQGRAASPDCPTADGAP